MSRRYFTARLVPPLAPCTGALFLHLMVSDLEHPPAQALAAQSTAVAQIGKHAEDFSFHVCSSRIENL